MEFVLFTVFQFKDKVLSLVDKQVIRKKNSVSKKMYLIRQA
jgi:hypothetical protein